MTDPDLTPKVSRRRGFSAVWIVPIVALVCGIWLVVYTYMTEGPDIEIRFETAEGLEAGISRIRVRNVVVGLVEDIRLQDDNLGVIVTAKLDLQAKSLLRKDTVFWVVRARIGAAGVTDLGTVISGAYIELAPGSGAFGSRKYVGLETPPLTPVGAPGLRLTLFSEKSASVSIGDPLLYNGFKVGRVESTRFDLDSRSIRHDVFVDAPYHDLVDSSVRFWDISGFQVDASADGIKLSADSIDTLLLGGVAFSRPSGMPIGTKVTNDAEFRLYGSFNEILEHPFLHGLYAVVAFSQSVRGLTAGAPVEYRGITIGRVERILLKELNSTDFGGGMASAIPVLIYIEPGRLELPDTSESVVEMERALIKGVQSGLRTTLQTGNLLTGRQFVNLDYYPDAEAASVSQIGDYPLIPSIPSGLNLLEFQIGNLLEKLNALPLDETLSSAKSTIDRVDSSLVVLTGTLESVRELLEAESTQGLTEDVKKTLEELRNTLKGFTPDAPIYRDLRTTVRGLNDTLDNLRPLIRTLSDRPSVLLFPDEVETDPEPKAETR